MGMCSLVRTTLIIDNEHGVAHEVRFPAHRLAQKALAGVWIGTISKTRFPLADVYTLRIMRLTQSHRSTCRTQQYETVLHTDDGRTCKRLDESSWT